MSQVVLEPVWYSKYFSSITSNKVLINAFFITYLGKNRYWFCEQSDNRFNQIELS